MTNPTALIIHGAYGTPQENWFPWLAEKLTENGFNVIIPQFPTPEKQNVATWRATVAPILSELDSQSLVIGHSIGATFVLRVLEQLRRPIDTAVLVAGFISDLPNIELNTINHSFYADPFEWDTIHHRARHLLQFHSHDDPYVPDAQAIELASNLRVEPIWIPHAGHFNTAAGYSVFPQLLDRLPNRRR